MLQSSCGASRRAEGEHQPRKEVLPDGSFFINLFGVAVAAAIACNMLNNLKDALGKKENDHDVEDHDR